MSKKDHTDTHIPDFVQKTAHLTDADQAKAPASLGHLTPDELEELLNDATAQLDDQKAQVMRLHAEMDNMRKRSEKDVTNAHKYGLERLISALLPVVDSLERGLEIQVQDNELAKGMQDGLEMTHSLFLSTLEKFSVKAVDPLDQPFNPELHQAISTEENKELPANTVVKVLQKGYTLNDRLVRPALVIVSKT